MLAQANVFMLDIKKVKLGIKRCSSSLNQSCLKQLFEQSKNDIKEIFRQCLLSLKEEQNDTLACEGKEQGLAICISIAVLLSHHEEAAVCAYLCPCPCDLGSTKSIQGGCSLSHLSPCTLLDSLHVMACPNCPLKILSKFHILHFHPDLSKWELSFPFTAPYY